MDPFGLMIAALILGVGYLVLWYFGEWLGVPPVFLKVLGILVALVFVIMILYWLRTLWPAGVVR